MNANQYERAGKAHPERDGGSAGRQPKDHMDNRRLGDKVRLHHRRSEAAGLQQTRQAGAWRREAVSGEGHSHQPSAADSTDRAVDRPANDRTEACLQTELCAPLPERRHSSIGRHRCRARGSQGRRCAAFCIASTKYLPNGNTKRLSQISVSQLYNLRRSAIYRRQRVRLQHTQSRRLQLARDASPIPRASQAICASMSILCIRAITTAKRACITSMPSTR